MRPRTATRFVEAPPGESRVLRRKILKSLVQKAHFDKHFAAKRLMLRRAIPQFRAYFGRLRLADRRFHGLECAAAKTRAQRL
jgi:hypothetical protein